MSQDSEAGRRDMTAVAYRQKSRHTGVDPGSVCAVSFHGSLWHTEDLRQAVCLHFADNHRRLIESAVLSWESLLKIQRVVAVMIGTVLPLLAAGAQAAELKVYSSTAVKAALEELGPQFEKATGDNF